MKTSDELIAGLPGEELFRQGFVDLQRGCWTIPSCVVAVARTRLTQAGLFTDSEISFPAEPERELYRLLMKEPGDAYSRYNSLIREFVSFEMALDRRVRLRDKS